MARNETVQWVIDLGGTILEESNRLAFTLELIGELADETGKVLKREMAPGVAAVRAGLGLLGNAATGAGAKLQTGLLDKITGLKTSLVGLGEQLGAAAKDLQRSQLLSQFETMASLLIQAGGPMAQFGVITASAARPVAMFYRVLGPIPLVFAAIPIAAFAALGAIKALANAALEAEERLRKLNVVTQKGSSTELKQYTRATTMLAVEMDKLKVTLGEGVAPLLTTMATALASGVSSLNSYATALGDVNTKLGTLQSWLSTISDIGLFVTSAGTIQVGREVLKMSVSDPGSFEGSTRNTIDAQNKAAQEVVDKVNKAAQAKADEQVYKDEIELIEDQRRVAQAQLQANKEFEALLKDNPGLAVLHALGQARDGQLSRFFEDSDSDVARLDAAVGQRAADRRAADAAQTRSIEQLRYDMMRGHSPGLAAGVDPNVVTGPEDDGLRYDKHGNVIAQRSFERYQLSQQGVAGLSTAFSGGDLGGVLSAAGAGPWGMVLGALNKDTPEMLEKLFEQVLDLYTDLPEIIGDLAQRVVPDLIRAAPEMAAAFTVIGPATAAALVESAPQLFASLVEALYSLPDVLAEKLLELPDKFAEAVKNALNPIDIGAREDGTGLAKLAGAGLGLLFGGPLGALVGATLGSAAVKGGKNGKFLGFFGEGSKGPLQQDGFAFVHKGEEILNPAETRARREGRDPFSRGHRGGGLQIGTVQVVSNDPRQFWDQLRSNVGSFGLGWELEPFGSG